MEHSQSGRSAWSRLAVVAAGLALLLLANYYLRHSLEEAPRRMVSFMETFYGPQIPVVFAKPWWQLLLPIREFTGAWAASTMILTYALERRLTPGGVWELYNALAILVAFGTSWALFRSAIFSFTFAICLGFGTQFYHAYAVTGGIASYLVASYHMLLLFTAVQLVRGVGPRWLWYLAFAFSLALNIFGYEGWLDVLTLVWVSAPVVYFGLQRLGRQAEASRLLRVVGALTLAGILYIAIKVTFGFQQTQGSESDVLFNYNSLWLFTDDLISNVFTHTYLSISNFLPPMFVGASSFYQLGPDRLVGAQHGYHEAFLYLVPMHQVFFWRYYAGAALVLVCFAIVRAVMRMWQRPSLWTLALIVFLLMLLVPGATHTMIKFRPMNAMPVMTYHVTVGVIGASLLISWLLTSAQRSWSPRSTAALVVVVWATLFYGALARPPYLAHMAAQSGLGNLIYPNPMKTLVEKLGGTYTAPSGLLLYELMPFRRDDQIASARALLGDLPDALPLLDQWTTTSEQITTRQAAGGLDVIGDATQYGYQLMTPPIAVRSGSSYLVRVKFEVQEGRVCAGILSGDQQRWVVPPDGATAEFQFNAAALDAVRVVFANCYLVDSGNPNSRFRVSGGSVGRLAGRESP